MLATKIIADSLEMSHPVLGMQYPSGVAFIHGLGLLPALLVIELVIGLLFNSIIRQYMGDSRFMAERLFRMYWK